MAFEKKIFREYDIRGVFEKDFDSDFPTVLGHSLVDYLDRVTKPAHGRRFVIAVGYDCRPSGEILAPRFIKALLASQCDVIELGVVPTPLVYFASKKLPVDAAVSITGSHNPSEYNGFKVCVGNGTLHGDEIQKLYGICQRLAKQPPLRLEKGSLTKHDIIVPYQEYVTGNIHLDRPLRVVVDAGNGTAAVVAPKLLKSLGCKVIPLFCDLDGRFPNHHPDPTVMENLEDLRKEVLKNKADLGIAYDGDADRIGAIDEKGRVLFGDELMVLYSREILARKPGATIISEVKCSSRLFDDIEKHGGKAIMWKTGHSLIKAKMKEETAELAGEMSGHMFFADRYFGYDDAIYASVRLLELLSKQERPLSALLADVPPAVSTPEIRIDCDDEIKFQVVKRVREMLSKKHKTIDIDGVRIETPTGWGLLRASNTQPVVVMRFEAKSKGELSKIQELIEQAFAEAKKELGT